jgi:hypothetical protein
MEVFVETRKSSFVDHLNIVESGREKTASSKVSGKEGDSILAKLAAELGVGKAPVAEGEKEVSTKDVTGVSPAVSGATDGVADPQLALAGTDLARQAAGMVPHLQGDINTPVAISTADGDAQTAEGLNRTDAAVAAASREAGGKQGGELESAATRHPEAVEAEKVGQMIARSFQQTLEKDAADAEYSQSLNILDQAGLLANYNIVDQSITKTASVEEVDILEKIANNQPLTREDIVIGARQYLEVEKLAAQADAEGRELAHKAVAEAIEQEKVAEANKTEQEKVAELAKDPKVMEAVKVLKAAGVL